VTAIYVIDGHDITLYSSPEAAASDIEDYDAHDLDYLGVDGTVWKATVAGPAWGPVTLHPTDEQRPDLVARLRAAGYELDDISIGGT
jgi:hypothetical protein